jgi:hypothetical protein
MKVGRMKGGGRSPWPVDTCMCAGYTRGMYTHAPCRAIAACLYVMTAAEAASQSQLAIDFTTGIERAPVDNSNYGWAFAVTDSITIDGLGIWDAGSNGLIDMYMVGLWRTLGNIGEPELIASEEVNNNDSVPVPSNSASGRWLFSNISPLKLDSGTYIIGTYYRSGPTSLFDPFMSDALPISTAAGLQYGSPREIHNTGGLTCPTGFGLNEHNGFFGPNFRVVPEPATTTLTLAPLILLLRRKRPCG